MKNKIILLLVLLIPSLCYGLSIKFTIKSDNKSYVSVSILTNWKIDQSEFLFRMVEGNKIIFRDFVTPMGFGNPVVLDNGQEVIKFIRVCYRLFGSSTTQYKKYFYRDETRLNKEYMIDLNTFKNIEDIGIISNFSVSKDNLVNGNETTTIYRFYKPD